MVLVCYGLIMYGIIDLGSNTVRLNVYQVIDKRVQLIFSKKEFVSLASFVNAYQQLSEEGIQAALSVIKHYVTILQNLNIKDNYLIATASIRNVTNKLAVIEKIKKVVSFSVELLSEEQEALADLEGVLIDTKFDKGLVVDIGGGSTELVAFEKQEVIYAKALKIGSLSAYVDYVSKIIPKNKELKKIKQAVIEAMDKLELPTFKPKTLYGVGGTIRAARKLAVAILSLPTDHKELTLIMVKDLIKFFQEKDKDAYVKAIQVVPERLHTILPGLKILETIIKAYGRPLVVVSDYGVREGYLIQKLQLVPTRVVKAPLVVKAPEKAKSKHEKPIQRPSRK